MFKKITKTVISGAGLGRYIISPKVFSVLENLEKGVGDEIQFTDAMNKMMKTEKFYACKLDADYYDTSSKLGYLKANIDFTKDRDEFKESLTTYFNN